jgi:hypothetical protein
MHSHGTVIIKYRFEIRSRCLYERRDVLNKVATFIKWIERFLKYDSADFFKTI